MNIYKFEMKKYIKSVILWSVSISAIMIMFMAMFPTFSEDAKMMDKILENYPEELLKVFGMTGNLSLATIAGYLVFVFAFIQLCFAIQASNYGFAMLSVEERELTADFLMSKPVTRKNIIISKFLAACTALVITNIVIYIVTFVSIEVFGNGKVYNAGDVCLVLLSVICFQLFFLTFGMLISVLVKKIRSVLSYSMAISFGLYVANALRSIIGGELLGVFSPYYHFEPGYILEHGKYNYKMALISIIFIIISMVTSYRLYIKRNIHSL